MSVEYNGEIVESLRFVLYEGRSLDMVPDLLIKVIEEDLWQEFYDELAHTVVTHLTFEHFVTDTAPQGLGTTVERLMKVCYDNKVAMDAIGKATETPQGAHHDNIMMSEQGTSSAYALRKLRSDAPEIHTKVIAGEISPNAGMIKAGFRKKTMQCPVEVEAVVRAIRSHFTEAEIKKIGTFLVDSATR